MKKQPNPSSSVWALSRATAEDRQRKQMLSTFSMPPLPLLERNQNPKSLPKHLDTTFLSCSKTTSTRETPTDLLKEQPSVHHVCSNRSHMPVLPCPGSPASDKPQSMELDNQPTHNSRKESKLLRMKT